MQVIYKLFREISRAVTIIIIAIAIEKERSSALKEVEKLIVE